MTLAQSAALLAMAMLAAACRSAPVVPSPAAPGAPVPGDTVVPFALIEPGTTAYPEQRLSGVVRTRGNVVDVLVTGGSLTTDGPRWKLSDLRAALGMGDPSSRSWSTPFRSDSIPARRLVLAHDGTVSDTIRFRLHRATRRQLEDHWLTFEMHGLMVHPKLGVVEVVEWFTEDRAPLIGRTTDAAPAGCTILADPDLAHGSEVPPLPGELPVFGYPPELAAGRRGDSARVRVAVDRHGWVPRCAVSIDAVSDSALLPHVAPAAARLHFEPARRGGVAVPSWIALTLRFLPVEQLQASANATLEVVVAEMPVLLRGSPAPTYPADLLPQRLEGRVVIRAIVTREGRIDPGSVQVVRSAHPLFTAAVRDVLPRLRFLPARRGPGGPTIDQQVEIPFDFRVPLGEMVPQAMPGRPGAR